MQKGIVIKNGLRGVDFTNFRIGGVCNSFLKVLDEEALLAVLEDCQSKNQNWRVVGFGSNLLVADAGLNETVLQLSGTFGECHEIDTGRFEVGAGVSLMRLSQRLTEAGFSGLEFAAGIPGSVGGAVVMNAGAHGSDMSQVVKSVRVLTGTGAMKVIPVSDLNYSYRHSILVDSDCTDLDLNRRLIVLSAIIQLRPGDASDFLRVRSECLAYRKATQPLTEPSAGSVFTNPLGGFSAGYMIEACGLKGKVCGGAHISMKHANWIVNHSRKARAEDVRCLMKQCEEEVEKKFGIILNREVKYWS
jgi:UDP-N-acetylmuramate dehydrogenase